MMRATRSPEQVAAQETQEVSAFREALQNGDVRRVRDLLDLPHVRGRVNDPMFAFGQRRRTSRRPARRC